MKPEERAEIILWDWLKTKGKFVNEIYFNRVNKLNAPVFTTKGINRKPDFIIKINRGFGEEYIALEIKTGSDRNIHDSNKILMYYENYIKHDTKYYINDKEINIQHFCVASLNSINGCLFNSSDWISNLNMSSDVYRNQSSEFGFLPEWETQRTSDYQRRLWSEWRNFKRRIHLERKELPSIGILIGERFSKNPNLFIMWWTKNKKWGQRWWTI